MAMVAIAVLILPSAQWRESKSSAENLFLRVDSDRLPLTGNSSFSQHALHHGCPPSLRRCSTLGAREAGAQTWMPWLRTICPAISRAGGLGLEFLSRTSSLLRSTRVISQSYGQAMRLQADRLGAHSPLTLRSSGISSMDTTLITRSEQ